MPSLWKKEEEEDTTNELHLGKRQPLKQSSPETHSILFSPFPLPILLYEKSKNIPYENLCSLCPGCKINSMLVGCLLKENTGSPWQRQVSERERDRTGRRLQRCVLFFLSFPVSCAAGRFSPSSQLTAVALPENGRNIINGFWTGYLRETFVRGKSF